MSYEFTKLPEVEVLENLTENAHLIVEDGGKTRRFPVNNGGAGYTEKGKVYTYDGDKTGKPVVEDCLVKISDTPIDVNKVESLKFGGVIATRENFTLMHESYMSAIVIDNVGLVMSVPEDAPVDSEYEFTRGLWVMHFPTGNYVSEVVLTETIRPIDPKYLPCIRLTDYGPGEFTVNDIVVNIVMGGESGGFAFSLEDGCENLWQDILKIKPTHMILDTGADVRASVNMLCAGDGIDTGSWFVSGNGAVSYYGMNINIAVILSAINDANGVKVSVLIEPVEFQDIVL